MIKISKADLQIAINSSLTMSEACSKLGIHFNTFKRYAIKYDLYIPNQGGKGTHRPGADINRKIKAKDILNGKFPQYQTFKLKRKLLKCGILHNKCDECGITEWQNKTLEMELDHIDGDKTNHKLKNLRMLCPNCHAQTDTYRGKNI